MALRTCVLVLEQKRKTGTGQLGVWVYKKVSMVPGIGFGTGGYT